MSNKVLIYLTLVIKAIQAVGSPPKLEMEQLFIFFKMEMEQLFFRQNTK